MAKKIVKREFFTALLTQVQETGFSTDRITNEDFINFISHELELLEKKNSTERKPTAKQMENDGIKTAILDSMTAGTLYTITDFIKTVPECADMSNQKISAIVRQLKDAGLVERVEEKRKAYFKLPE